MEERKKNFKQIVRADRLEDRKLRRLFQHLYRAEDLLYQASDEKEFKHAKKVVRDINDRIKKRLLERERKE